MARARDALRDRGAESRLRVRRGARQPVVRALLRCAAEQGFGCVLARDRRLRLDRLREPRRAGGEVLRDPTAPAALARLDDAQLPRTLDGGQDLLSPRTGPL